MSDGDRGAGSPALGADLKFLLAVLLACVVGLLFGYLEGYQAERHKNSAREYAEAAKQNAIIACADREPAAVADCVYDEINSSREASQAEQDLQAQQWMARWAALLTLFTLATTLISWMALRYLRDTFQQTAKGAQAAADATEAMVRQNEIASAAQRAWIDIIPLIEVRARPDGRIYLKTFATFRNIGKSVATNVHIMSRFRTGAGSTIMKEHNELFRKMMRSGGALTLMPGGTRTGGQISDGYSKEWVTWDEKGRAPFAIITIAVYNIEGDDRKRFSRAIWYVRKQGDDRPGAYGLTWDELATSGLEIDPQSYLHCT